MMNKSYKGLFPKNFEINIYLIYEKSWFLTSLCWFIQSSFNKGFVLNNLHHNSLANNKKSLREFTLTLDLLSRIRAGWITAAWEYNGVVRRIRSKVWHNWRVSVRAISARLSWKRFQYVYTNTAEHWNDTFHQCRIYSSLRGPWNFCSPQSLLWIYWGIWRRWPPFLDLFLSSWTFFVVVSLNERSLL